MSADVYEYSSKRAKSTALGKYKPNAVLLNTKKDHFHRKRPKGIVGNIFIRIEKYSFDLVIVYALFSFGE